jgi:hypothetical protein
VFVVVNHERAQFSFRQIGIVNRHAWPVQTETRIQRHLGLPNGEPRVRRLGKGRSHR